MTHIHHITSLHNLSVSKDICRNVALIVRCPDDRRALVRVGANVEKLSEPWSSLKNCLPLKGFLSLPNTRKSQGTRSGLYGGCCQTSHLKLRSKSFVLRALRGLALSYKITMPSLKMNLRTFGTFCPQKCTFLPALTLE